MDIAALSSSGHILLIAEKAYRRSVADDRWDALSSMTLSVIGFECFINEFAEKLERDIMHQGMPALRDVGFALAAIEDSRGSVIAKLEAIVFYLTRARLDWGELPLQDLRVLLRIRNKLVHRKPEKIEYDFSDPDREYTPHSDVAYLISRKIITAPHPNSPAQWGSYVVCPESACWAYNTVVECIHRIIALLPEGTLSQILRLTTKELVQLEPPDTTVETSTPP